MGGIGVNDLQSFRAQKDDFFAQNPHSPLTHQQRADFRGLDYFPENPALCLEVDVERFAEKQEVQIQSTTGDVLSYTRLGRFTFTVEGQAAELTIYDSGEGYFLPFVDSLSGVETYPAGRYLEPEELAGGRFLVDFNLAYNPYCAYNDLWSCPITPPENRLKVPIRAGEKIFQK
jgi:hypothetical protein